MYRVLYITQVHSCHMQIRKIISSVLMVLTICMAGVAPPVWRFQLELLLWSWAVLKAGEPQQQHRASQLWLSGMALRARLCTQGLKSDGQSSYHPLEHVPLP